MSVTHNTPQYGEENFRKLFDSYLTRVLDYIGAITRSDYIAEEVAQELFIILWRKRADLQAVQNMDAYIFCIARNLAIRLLKKAAIDSKLATELYKRSIEHGHATDVETRNTGVQAIIDKAVLALPPQPRRVYFLSRRENLNVDEIAQHMGLSRNTVKNHLQKALQDIRNYLIHHGYQPTIILLLLKGIFRM